MALPPLDTWLACFERRAAQPSELPEGLEDRLSAEERSRIGRSIATFELGERSDGRTLRALAARYAERHDCPALVRITECFIREEQRHAALLAQFLADHDLPRLESAWSDGVFRTLRRLFGFESTLSVLITAELIGLQFYRAVMRGTESKRLRALCSTLMQDEALHVAYESELLLSLRAGRGRFCARAVTLLHGAFHVATALVVWLEHRQVFVAAGYSASEFLMSCARHYALYLGLPARGGDQGRAADAPGTVVARGYGRSVRPMR